MSSRTRFPASSATPGSVPTRKASYRGNCAELCGRDHGFMPIEVHVLSAEKYTEWVQQQAAAAGAEQVSLAPQSPAL
uniref:hypothetical protein n=1 Tax=Thauera sp. SDU_THAU2 TaxID=3136633 RepID=UPI00311DBDA3